MLCLKASCGIRSNTYWFRGSANQVIFSPTQGTLCGSKPFCWKRCLCFVLFPYITCYFGVILSEISIEAMVLEGFQNFSWQSYLELTKFCKYQKSLAKARSSCYIWQQWAVHFHVKVAWSGPFWIDVLCHVELSCLAGWYKHFGCPFVENCTGNWHLMNFHLSNLKMLSTELHYRGTGSRDLNEAWKVIQMHYVQSA